MTKLLIASVLIVPGFAAAQALDPALLTKPLGDSWPTYSGDYSGKRYSSLKQINQTNVKHLTLAWVRRVTSGKGGAASATPIIVGGEGPGEEGVAGFGGVTNIRASILEVNGILYVSPPHNPWALG